MMKKHFFLFLFFLQIGSLWAQFEPSWNIESPNRQYLVKTWNYVQPAGFTPYRSKIMMEVFNASTKKRCNKLKIKDAELISNLVFSQDASILFVIIKRTTIPELVMIDFQKLCRGKKRGIGIRWNIYPYIDVNILEEKGVIRAIFMSQDSSEIQVDLTEYKEKLVWDVHNEDNAVRFFSQNNR